MLNQMLRKLIAVGLLVICPSTLLMAERPSAMLSATGAVTLNGTPTAKSTSLFDGDRVATADASVVSINQNGSSLVVDPNSSVRYRNDALTILKGTARIRTSKGMAAHAGPLSVIPKGDSARFDVSSDGKNITVVSREGTLTLTDGVETAALEPGFTAKVRLDSSDQDPKPASTASGQSPNPNSSASGQDQNPKAGSDQDQGPNPAATTSGGNVRRWNKGLIIWIIASAAVGAGIACAVACGGGGAAPVSPVNP
jgi:hypothetical protein